MYLLWGAGAGERSVWGEWAGAGTPGLGLNYLIDPRKLLWAFLLVKDPFRIGRHGTLALKWLSVWLFSIPWIAACQAPPSMEFSWQEYWSRLPFPSPTLALVIPKEPWLTVNIKEMWRKHWAREFTSQELCARAYNTSSGNPRFPESSFRLPTQRVPPGTTSHQLLGTNSV